jgi:hypothetical protein
VALFVPVAFQIFSRELALAPFPVGLRLPGRHVPGVLLAGRARRRLQRQEGEKGRGLALHFVSCGIFIGEYDIVCFKVL